jgi:hypothetical protein
MGLGDDVVESLEKAPGSRPAVDAVAQGAEEQ